VLVLWQHQIAGTTDRIVRIGNRRFVFDLKTGEAVYPHSFALQLAIYAMADHVYDFRTETLRPMPEVDQDRAIICHLPAKGGPCTLHWLDISAGREALEHALWVRTWRKRRDLLTKFDVPEVPNAEPPALEVVRDELQSGALVEHCRVPDLTESFYAIVQKCRFPNSLLTQLLGDRR
jgi:hypothetical protein